MDEGYALRCHHYGGRHSIMRLLMMLHRTVQLVIMLTGTMQTLKYPCKLAWPLPAAVANIVIAFSMRPCSVCRLITGGEPDL